MTVEIRAARPVDAEPVTDVFLSARAASMPYLPIVHSAEATLQWVRDVVLVEQRVWVATASGGPGLAGFAALHGGWLEHLYVRPGHTGRGIGTTLLTTVRSTGTAPLRLRVFRRNDRAVAFYRRHGFRLLDTDDGTRNEEGEPDATYVWP